MITRNTALTCLQVTEGNEEISDSESDVGPPLRKVIKNAKGKGMAVKAEPSPDIETDSEKKEEKLPAFTSKKWTSVFLPTLRRHMLCSKEPFANYVKSPVFVAVV